MTTCSLMRNSHDVFTSGHQPTHLPQAHRHTVIQTMISFARLITAICFSQLLGSQASASAGQNCDTVAPPDRAGYTVMMGVAMQVYPDHTAIDATYQGCQSLWSLEGTSPRLEMRIRYLDGKPSQVIDPHTRSPLPLDCQAATGRGPGAFQCTPLGLQPFHSYPKACINFRDSPPDSQGYFINKSCR